MSEQELLSYTPLICDIINKRFRFFLINNQHLYDDLIQSAYLQILEKISYFDESKCKKSTFVYLVAYQGMLQYIYKWYGRNKNFDSGIDFFKTCDYTYCHPKGYPYLEQENPHEELRFCRLLLLLYYGKIVRVICDAKINF